MGFLNPFKYLIFNTKDIIFLMYSLICTLNRMVTFFCLLSVHGGKGIRYTTNEDTPPEKRRCQLCYVKHDCLPDQLTFLFELLSNQLCRKSKMSCMQQTSQAFAQVVQKLHLHLMMCVCVCVFYILKFSSQSADAFNSCSHILMYILNGQAHTQTTPSCMCLSQHLEWTQLARWSRAWTFCRSLMENTRST